MLDVMYNYHFEQNLSKIVVDADFINNKEKNIFKQNKKQEKPAKKQEKQTA